MHNGYRVGYAIVSLHRRVRLLCIVHQYRSRTEMNPSAPIQVVHTEYFVMHAPPPFLPCCHQVVVVHPVSQSVSRSCCPPPDRLASPLVSSLRTRTDELRAPCCSAGHKNLLVSVRGLDHRRTQSEVCLPRPKSPVSKRGQTATWNCTYQRWAPGRASSAP